MKRIIAKASFRLKGDQARELLCILSTDAQLLEMYATPELAPEMRNAVTTILMRRDLLPDNYQI